MNLVKCSNNHYYDADKFPSCPYCSSQSSGDSVTVALSSGGSSDRTMDFQSAVSDESMTVARPADQEPVTQKSVQARQESAAIPKAEPADFQDILSRAQQQAPVQDDNLTVSYYSQAISAPMKREPVVGWLVCTIGTYFGQSFPLKSGRNFLGRGGNMDVCLEGENSVSRERHAVIIYEPRERMFLAQPGDSRELFYVNDDVVLDNVVLKPYDRISLGKVDLMLIPFCCKEFAWEDLDQEKKDVQKK